jgi:hypothetical protein
MGVEEEKLVGACGLYCGLCPRFHSKDKFKCPGCKLSEAHTWCGIFRCCVMERYLTTCADCDEYPCERLLQLTNINSNLSIIERFIKHKPILSNLDIIKGVGIEFWLKEQKERRLLLEYLLTNYDDGRSINFYCVVCNFMPIDLIESAISEVKKMIVEGKIDGLNLKVKIEALKSIIKKLAIDAGIELKV